MTSRAGTTILERILDGREPLLDLMSEYRAAIEQEVRDDIRARVEKLTTNFRPTIDNPAVPRKEVLAAISSSSATETQDGPPVVEESELDDQPEMLASDRFYATETQDNSNAGSGLGSTTGSSGLMPAPDASDGMELRDAPSASDRRTFGPESLFSASNALKRAIPTTETQDGERRGRDWLGNWLTDALDRCNARDNYGLPKRPADLGWMLADELIAANLAATPTPDDRDREALRLLDELLNSLNPNDYQRIREARERLATPDDRDREVERIKRAIVNVNFRAPDDETLAASLYDDAGLRASGGTER